MRNALSLPLRLFVVCAMVATTAPACWAEDDDYQEGMHDYKRHDWAEALAHFGAALPHEFNSANLHYHMANCMVHMRKKESAISEYRIAYALDPHGKIGNYSKMCLHLFGIDAAGFLPFPEAPAKIEKSKEREVDTLAKKDSKDSKDAKDSKDGRESRDVGLAKVAKYVTEEDRVRQNLQEIMVSKHRPGSAKLQEIGTNVFVRNYKEPPRAQTIAVNEKQISKPADKSVANEKQTSKPVDRSIADNKQSNKH